MKLSMKWNLPLGLLLLLASCSPTSPAAEAPLVQVTVTRVQRRSIQHTIDAPATLYPIEEATLSSRFTSTVDRVEVRKGDRVTKGQLLVALDDRDLAAQRSEAALAVADAEASLQRLREGTLPGDLERARGQVQTSDAVLEQARDTYERRSRLFEEGAIPKKQLLASETELERARVDSQNAHKSLDLLTHQTREQDIKIATLKRDQQKARLDLLDTQLSFTRIRSPFAGFVTEQYVYPGDMAQPSTPLLKVSNTSTLVARAQVPETSAVDLAVGQSCRFTSQDFPEAGLDGRLTVVNQAIDPIRRSVEVWCRLSESSPRAHAGSFGNTVFVTSIDTGLVVPKAAVQFEEGSRKGTVMVVDSSDVAHGIPVETRPTSEPASVEILSGLEEGDRVIVSGGYGLPDGTKVQLAESTQSPMKTGGTE